MLSIEGKHLSFKGQIACGNLDCSEIETVTCDCG